MRSRYIVVPKDSLAEDALNIDSASDDQIIKMILNQDEFNLMYDTKFLDIINEICGTHLDSYDEDIIKSIDDIKEVHSVLLRNIDKFDNETKCVMVRILNMFKEAFVRETSVWIYL